LRETDHALNNLNDENIDVASEFPEANRDLKTRHLTWLQPFSK
jgi:hypothetical protein